MVLFPFALIWLVVLIVWVVRNEKNREEGDPRRWAWWRPSPPRDPRRGGPDRVGGRRGAGRAESRDASPRS
ncbi:MAG TPA: hypothetical protein VFU10_11320 [Gaiellaceae bacterium]|nr:hypothetical protein [Gaiellaceae bacterium]